MSVFMEGHQNDAFVRDKNYGLQITHPDQYTLDQTDPYLSAPQANTLYRHSPSNSFSYHPSTVSNHPNSFLAAQTWSPSTASEHISPAAFSSENGFSDITQHSSPSGLERISDMGYLSIMDASDLTSDVSFGPSSRQLTGSKSDMTLSYNNTQMPAFESRSLSQHLSPDLSQQLNAGYGGSNTFQQTPQQFCQSEDIPQSSGVGTTNMPSLNIAVSSNSMAMALHMPSPIVRVETCSRSNSPLDVPTSPKREHTSRKSSVHLSPYQNESSDDESDDGNTANRRVGMGPQAREILKDAYVSNFEDTEKAQLTAERNLEVEEWLSHSEISSLADEDDLRARSLKKKSIKGRRRAKSTNDAAASPNSRPINELALSVSNIDDFRIPGPGIYIDERSEVDEAEDDDEENSEKEFSLESPAAVLNISGRDSDESYFPHLAANSNQNHEPQTIILRPWADSPSETENAQPPYQPLTSNAAMMRFKQRAKDIESASLTATIGSRRNRSDTDLTSLFSATGISAPVQTRNEKSKNKDSRLRRGSFLENLLPRKSNTSNILKRKQSQAAPSPKQIEPLADQPTTRKDSEVSFSAPRRIGSWGRPKSPKPDTGVSKPAADTKTATAPTIIVPPSGPLAQVKNVIRRSRSRTDIGKSTKGLAELMTQFGGPPVVSINSPTPDVNEQSSILSQIQQTMKSSGPTDSNGSIFMDLAVRSDPIIPTLDGFRVHVRQLNPRLPEVLLERLTQEQQKRFKRLLQMKIDHLKTVKNGKCSSGKLCTAQGGEPQLLPPRPGGKDSDAPLVGFFIMQPGMSEDDIEVTDGSMVPANFPAGIPLPPVKSLPAEFECPLCFKVKKFAKPSDWTKHVREDTQPFTCTFPSCVEPRSFSRKADWVRHESERHRQLDYWTCDINECMHTCYRRDNFVQHLDREHKLPVTRLRPVRGTGGSKSPVTPLDPLQSWQGANLSDKEIDVARIIERCYHKEVKHAKDEPCRFCGNILNDWKKLEVHLSKHMEQISLPILPLVEQRKVDADTKLSPIDDPQRSPVVLVSPSTTNNMPYFTEPMAYESPLSNDLRSSAFPPFDDSATNFGLPSNVSNTYPPPQLPVRTQATSHLTASTYGYHGMPDPNGTYYPLSNAVTPPNVRSSPTNMSPSFSTSDPNRFAQAMGNTYPPLLTIPSSGYGQQPYRSPSPNGMPMYGTPNIIPTYVQQDNFTGSPTGSGSNYDQQVSQGPSPVQAGQYSPYAQHQGYFQSS